MSHLLGISWGYNRGLSENSVPLHPMVLLIIIPIKWLFHWEYTLFSDKPIGTSEQAIEIGKLMIN